MWSLWLLLEVYWQCVQEYPSTCFTIIDSTFAWVSASICTLCLIFFCVGIIAHSSELSSCLTFGIEPLNLFSVITFVLCKFWRGSLSSSSPWRDFMNLQYQCSVPFAIISRCLPVTSHTLSFKSSSKHGQDLSIKKFIFLHFHFPNTRILMTWWPWTGILFGGLDKLLCQPRWQEGNQLSVKINQCSKNQPAIWINHQTMFVFNQIWDNLQCTWLCFVKN